MLRTIDPVASTTLRSYEHQQLLHRARRYIYIKGAVNMVIVLLFLLTFPPELRLRMVAITLVDGLFLVPYWFLIQRYPTLATCLSLCITSLAISAGDWVGGYQTGASGIFYALLILGGHLVLINPLRTYLIAGLITAIYVGTIALEVQGVIPIKFPFTMSNLSRVVSLNVISMFGLTVLTSVVTRLYRELLRRNKALSALNTVSTTASQSLNLDAVLQLALDSVLEVMELEGGGLYLLEANTGEMVLKAHRNLTEEFVGRVSRMEVGIEGFTDSPLRMGQVLVVNDPSQHPIVSKVIGEENWHHPLAIVPLKIEDKVLGAMNLLGRTGCSFASQDVELLSTIGAQVGLAIERAQLYEREQKRAAQLAVVNQVARRAASILDMDQLLQEVVTAIQRGFNYYNVALSLLNEAAGKLEVQAVAGGFTDLVSLDYCQAVGMGMVGWVAETGQSLLANDVSQEPRYILGFLGEPLTKSELCVPLKLADRVIGVLDVQDTQLNAFDETDLLAMETLADQLAVAIETARLYEEEQRRLQELKLLIESSASLSSLETDEILKSAAEQMAKAAGVYKCVISGWDEQKGIVRTIAEFSRMMWAWGEGATYDLEDYPVTAKVLRTGQPLVVWVSDPAADENERAWLQEWGMKSLLLLPLQVKGTVIGLVELYDAMVERQFTDDEIALCQSLATQAAIAIQQTRPRGEVIEEVLYDIAEQMIRAVDVQGGVISGWDEQKGIVRTIAEFGRATWARGEGVTYDLEDYPATAEVLRTGQPLVVWVSDPAADENERALLQEWGMKSLLLLPLQAEGTVIGLVELYDAMVERRFTDDEIVLCQSLATQATIAIERARLYATGRQQLYRLQELAVASQQITADLDLASVLERIEAQALATLEADRAAVFLFDWETDSISYAHASGLSPEYVDEIRRRYREVPGRLVLDSPEPIHILDAQTNPATEAVRESVLREGYHTLAVLPLIGRGKTMGALALYRDAIRAFSPEMLALAQSFANQAGVAIENARLYQQTDEKLQVRVRQLTALYAVAEIVNYSDLDAVLHLALDSAIGVTGMDSGGILLLGPSSNEIFLRAQRGWSPEFIRAVSHTRADEGLMPQMLQSVMIIDDLSKLTHERQVAIEREGLQSVISIPLKARESTVGVMGVTGRSPRTFASEELELLAAIGNQVGVAVDRANLQAEELRAAILEERQHMAQQMHDDITQTLGYLGLQVDSVMGNSSLAQNVEVQAKLEEIRRAIEDAYERVRSSIIRLGEDVPGHFDLGAALPEIISEFEKQTECKVESRVDEGQLLRLPPSVAFQATYIIREALANIRKHSGADSVCLMLQGLEDGRVEVTIQDNGRGFDLGSEQQSGWGGFGLRFMRERAERVGGSLSIESGPGQGTRVVVSLPSG